LPSEENKKKRKGPSSQLKGSISSRRRPLESERKVCFLEEERIFFKAGRSARGRKKGTVATVITFRGEGC